MTPRPIYPADGRKIPDIYSQPGGPPRPPRRRSSARFRSSTSGDRTPDIASSEWIADASMRGRSSGTRRRCCSSTCRTSTTTCSDSGPTHPRIRDDVARHRRDLRQADRAVAASAAAASSCCRSTGSCRCRGPVHINRVLREAGLLAVRDELGTDALDAGASEAFAVADHQVAHVYVRDPARIAEVEALLRAVPGVDAGARSAGAGAAWASITSAAASWSRSRPPIAWFTYYYWLDDRARAGLRAHRRHPPQARLRPGRAVPRSGAARCRS